MNNFTCYSVCLCLFRSFWSDVLTATTSYAARIHPVPAFHKGEMSRGHRQSFFLHFNKIQSIFGHWNGFQSELMHLCYRFLNYWQLSLQLTLCSDFKEKDKMIKSWVSISFKPIHTKFTLGWETNSCFYCVFADVHWHSLCVCLSMCLSARLPAYLSVFFGRGCLNVIGIKYQVRILSLCVTRKWSFIH